MRQASRAEDVATRGRSPRSRYGKPHRRGTGRAVAVRRLEAPREARSSASGAEKREHGEHATVVVRARGQAELREDARHVLLDRPERDEHALGDRLIRASFRHELEHLALARREQVEWIVASLAAYQLAHDGGIERRAAVGDPPNRGAELLEVG